MTQRTASLSFTYGAVAAGSIPSFALGGFINRVLGARGLFCVTLGVITIALFWASTSLVQETFGGERRQAARQERLERRSQARERSLERWNNEEGDATRGVRRGIRKSFEAIAAVFDPILRLKPTRHENGRLNIRLVTLGAGYFFGTLGTGYITPALISFMTIALQQNPEQVGSFGGSAYHR